MMAFIAVFELVRKLIGFMPRLVRNELIRPVEHQTNKSVVMAIAGATDSKIDYHAFEEGGRTNVYLIYMFKKQTV